MHSDFTEWPFCKFRRKEQMSAKDRKTSKQNPWVPEFRGGRERWKEHRPDPEVQAFLLYVYTSEIQARASLGQNTAPQIASG